jgi:hypothetical protein
MYSTLEYPLKIEHGSIKIKPENMIADQLYHCIFEDKVFLFYKDEEEILHCYEVEDQSATNEIAENPSDIENILRRHSQLK